MTDFIENSPIPGITTPNLPAVLTGETGPGSDRKKFIGGSDVAAILGLSKWTTPYKLFLKKMGRYEEPIDPKKAKRLNRGKRWEQPAFEMLMDALELRDIKVEVVGRNRRYQDSELPFLACELDAELLITGSVEINGIVYDFDREPVTVEIKTVDVRAASDWGEMDTDQVPIYYATQAMHGLGIVKRRWCIVGALFGADDLVPYFVERDDETITGMREKCRVFWFDHILADRAPEPNTWEDMMHILGKYRGRPVHLEPEEAVLLDELTNLGTRMSALDDQRDLIKFDLADIIRKKWNLLPGEDIADNAILLCNGVEIGSWKAQSKDTVNAEGLRLKHPDIAREFTKTSHFRVFRKKKAKK